VAGTSSSDAGTLHPEPKPRSDWMAASDTAIPLQREIFNKSASMNCEILNTLPSWIRYVECETDR